MKLAIITIITLISWNVRGNPLCLDLLSLINQARVLPELLIDKQQADFERCREYFQKEKALCEKGRLFSCHSYAYSLAVSEPQKKLEQLKTFNKACQKNYVESCFMAEKLKFEIRKKRAPIFLFDKFCGQGSNLACWRAARAHAKRKEYDPALASIKLSCKSGDKFACGKVLALKKGVEDAIEKPVLLEKNFLTTSSLIMPKKSEVKKEAIAKPQNTEPAYCSTNKNLVRKIEKEKRILGKHLAEFFSQAYAKSMEQRKFRDMQLRYLMRLGVFKSFELVDIDGLKVRPQSGVPSPKVQRVFKKMKKKVKVYSNRLSSANPIIAIPIIKRKKETMGLISLSLKGIDKNPAEGCKKHLDRLLGLYIFARSKLYLEQLQFNKLNAGFLKNKEGVEQFFFINSLGKIISPKEDRGKDIIDSFSSKAFDELIRKSLDRPFFIEADPNSEFAYIAHPVKTEGQIIASGILTLKFKIAK